MSTPQISSNAEAAREAHRNPDGKFGVQPATEPDQVDLGAGAADLTDEDREELRGVVRTARALSIDPATGQPLRSATTTPGSARPRMRATSRSGPRTS